MKDAKMLKLEKYITSGIILDIDRNDAIRLIDNIISNAIKYNKQAGTIIVTLDNNNFKVKDTGIGIDEDKIENIMNRFQRANSTEGGFGIGLHIVQQVVKYYNFNIKIHSIAKEGTEVIIQWQK